MGLLDTTQRAYYDGNNLGNYQFTSLHDVVNQFMIAYVGEDKIISKIKRVDVAFHAQRALQELSFDTFKSCKSQEIEITPNLTMPLPHDYVNYTKVSWIDGAGIKHLMYPTSKTSDPKPILQNSDGEYKLTAIGTMVNTSDSIILDAAYTNIYVGMPVQAPNIPVGTTVAATSTVSDITTITISADATYTGTETLLFSTPGIFPVTAYPSGDLLEQQTSSLVLTGLSWAVTEDKITAASSSDAATVSVGMMVSHEDFPTGTVVVDVNGAVITTSTNAQDNGSGENANFLLTDKSSDTWAAYKSATPSENQNQYDDDTYWPLDGSRYGLDPQHAQANGSFYIDCQSGKIHFSSNISGKTVILDYISDSLGTDAEMQVHKFAEEAMYKWIAYAILSTRANTQENIVRRFKKERFAAIRSAKLRLSNIKLEEITQVLRGKSKQIKH